MARLSRPYLPDCPQHIIQRGNNREACFGDDADYVAYLHHLKATAEKSGWGSKITAVADLESTALTPLTSLLCLGNFTGRHTPMAYNGQP